MSASVVLVNEMDEAIGTMEKMEAHEKGLLHRAFSVFVFNKEGLLLLQRRALSKYHSAGLWTNTCCSHPFPGEAVADAAVRRLKEELGFTTPLRKVFDFKYEAAFDNGLIEHEFDHVFVGEFEGAIEPNPEEVHEFKYVSMEEVEQDMKQQPELYTAWFHIAFPKLKKQLERE